MVNEILYCERLFFLEWCQREFEDNVFTVDGKIVHRRTDAGRGRLREPSEGEARVDGEQVDATEERPYVARSVWLTSKKLDLTAKLDVVEVDGGEVVPIEYKRGKAPKVPEGAYLPERAQLCAHVLLLREHGYRCTRAEMYFAEDRRRVPIAIDAHLIELTLGAIRRARELEARGTLPPPLRDSPKCDGCSLAGICLPDELNLIREGHLDVGIGREGTVDGEAADARETVGADEVGAPEADEDGGAEESKLTQRVRRLYAQRDDRVPLYVQSNRARIGVRGERLTVRDENQEATVRLPNTSHVAIYGNTQISTQALRALLEREIPFAMFSYGGWYLGRMEGHGTKNVALRTAQYRLAEDRGFALRIARRFVASKILNCRTMLRRNHAASSEVDLRELKILAARAQEAEGADTLLGIEGNAARIYFAAFTGMLKAETGAFDLESRNRRPPRDPINALLSFTYGLLTKDVGLALSYVGLDPLCGFYHRPRHGRPGLALDLMEEFRPLIADSVVISAVNTGVVTEGDFIRSAGGCAIKPHARKRLIAAYERRMDQLILHPIFEYRLSYRRVLELQARLLTRVLLGEISDYPMFRTR